MNKGEPDTSSIKPDRLITCRDSPIPYLTNLLNTTWRENKAFVRTFHSLLYLVPDFASPKLNTTFQESPNSPILFQPLPTSTNINQAQPISSNLIQPHPTSPTHSVLTIKSISNFGPHKEQHFKTTNKVEMN